jgi:hypothetical protein
LFHLTHLNLEGKDGVHPEVATHLTVAQSVHPRAGLTTTLNHFESFKSIMVYVFG